MCLKKRPQELTFDSLYWPWKDFCTHSTLQFAKVSVFSISFHVLCHCFYQLFYCSPTFFAHCQRDIFLQSAFSILYHLSSTRRFYATRLGIDVWPSAHCGLHRNLSHLIWMPCANFPKLFQLFKLSILKCAAV